MLLSRFAFLAVLAAGVLPLAAGDTTLLKVEVRTLGDRPVERAAVIVDFVEGRSVSKLGRKILKHWEVRTNQEGVAKLPTMPQGKIRLQVVAKGYQTFGEHYELDQTEQTITVKLNPPQPQYSAH